MIKPVMIKSTDKSVYSLLTFHENSHLTFTSLLPHPLHFPFTILQTRNEVKVFPVGNEGPSTRTVVRTSLPFLNKGKRFRVIKSNS